MSLKYNAILVTDVSIGLNVGALVKASSVLLKSKFIHMKSNPNPPPAALKLGFSIHVCPFQLHAVPGAPEGHSACVVKSSQAIVTSGCCHGCVIATFAFAAAGIFAAAVCAAA